MGYFDGLTDAAFKTDIQGRQVFYPWGVFGKGYVMRDVDHHQSVRGKLKLLYIITIFLFFFGQFIVGFKPMLVLLPFYIIGYLWMFHRWTAGLEISNEKMTVKEARQNSAKSHNRGTLIFLTVVSVLFVLLGLFMMAGGLVWQGLLCSGFFGACGFMIGLMVRDKSKAL